MENKDKKQIENINNSNEKLLLSDVIKRSEQFCTCHYSESFMMNDKIKRCLTCGKPYEVQNCL